MIRGGGLATMDTNKTVTFYAWLKKAAFRRFLSKCSDGTYPTLTQTSLKVQRLNELKRKKIPIRAGSIR